MTIRKGIDPSPTHLHVPVQHQSGPQARGPVGVLAADAESRDE
jgi:hypothetical protein